MSAAPKADGASIDDPASPPSPEPRFVVWNSCWHLPALAFQTLTEAKAYRTASGNPNRITDRETGEEWISCSVPDQAPGWCGPYARGEQLEEPADPAADRARAVALREVGHTAADLAAADAECGRTLLAWKTAAGVLGEPPTWCCTRKWDEAVARAHVEYLAWQAAMRRRDALYHATHGKLWRCTALVCVACGVDERRAS